MEASRAQRLNFPLLCFGQLVTQFGDSIFHIGLLWLALEITGSKSFSAVIAAAGYLPAVLLALAAGVVADRVDRRKLMIFCAAVQAAVVITALAAGAGPPANRIATRLISSGWCSGNRGFYRWARHSRCMFGNTVFRPWRDRNEIS